MSNLALPRAAWKQRRRRRRMSFLSSEGSLQCHPANVKVSPRSNKASVTASAMPASRCSLPLSPLRLRLGLSRGLQQELLPPFFFLAAEETDARRRIPRLIQKGFRRRSLVFFFKLEYSQRSCLAWARPSSLAGLLSAAALTFFFSPPPPPHHQPPHPVCPAGNGG